MATNHQQFPRIISGVRWTTPVPPPPPPMVSEISLRSPSSSSLTVANQSEVPRDSVTASCNGSYMDGCGSDGGERSVVRQCAACGQSISDRYLLHTMDGFWHVRCLRCSCCHVALAEIGTSCFSRAGMMLCKADYIRLFGSTGTCSGCGMTIPANEFVMKTQGSVYHVTCFACTTCHSKLVPGDRYGIINGSVICENDYCKLAKAQKISLRTNYKVCD